MTQVVRRGDVHDPRLIALLEAHIADMYATSPAESVHTLDLEALAAPDVRLVTVWEAADASRVCGADVLLGCGAMRLHEVGGECCGELKSMRTAPEARGRGVAGLVLDELMEVARAEGVARLFLETGPQEFFAPARALYLKHGFVECGPFGDYRPDPYSVFMTRAL